MLQTDLEVLKDLYDRAGVKYTERRRVDQPSTMPGLPDVWILVSVEAKQGPRQIGYTAFVSEHYFNNVGELVGTGSWEWE